MQKHETHPLISQFVNEFTEQRNWSKNFQQNVTVKINMLLHETKKTPTEISEEDIINFFKNKIEREYWSSGGTIIQALWIVRMFFRYLASKNLIERAYRLKVKIYKELPSGISRDIFSAVRRQRIIVNRFSTKIRNKAIWYLLYYSTAFANDICEIKVKNIDLDKGYIYLDNVKEGRIHYIILQDEAIRMLRLYIAKKKIEGEYLFRVAKDKTKPIGIDVVRYILRGISSRSGVRITHNELIELKIYLAIEANVDIRTLQYMFGVKNIGKFQKYIDMKNAKITPFKESRKMGYAAKRRHLL